MGIESNIVLIITLLLFLFILFNSFSFYEKLKINRQEPKKTEEKSLNQTSTLSVVNETAQNATLPLINQTALNATVPAANETPAKNYSSGNVQINESKDSERVSVSIVTSSQNFSKDKKVKGIIELRLNNAPPDIVVAGFILSKTPVGSIDIRGPSQTSTLLFVIDEDPSDGWSVLVDSRSLENGVYYLTIDASDKKYTHSSEYSPYYIYTSQLIIEN